MDNEDIDALAGTAEARGFSQLQILSSTSRRWEMRAGHTLLELLVAFAMVVVSVGLLLPAVLVARGTARSINCVNNLRQIGFAPMEYCDSKRSCAAAWGKDLLSFPDESHLDRELGAPP